ncbi:hypothetical protein GGS24DRAFT_482455 [Hypoxylon argillaceum]|nr:hypothetical protein GGS24DRAFT_482455 [Hypoxylon argillaceum]KAI1146525.1 hypothetical protein F4825DRAFT_440443 [Nemania diffusa]
MRPTMPTCSHSLNVDLTLVVLAKVGAACVCYTFVMTIIDIIDSRPSASISRYKSRQASGTESRRAHTSLTSALGVMLGECGAPIELVSRKSA